MKKIIKLLLICLLPCCLIGCEIFGLELQENVDFDDTKIDNTINMNAWEYIKANSNQFSLMQEAIEYTGLQSEYEASDRTFLLLTNYALGDEVYSQTYFIKNKVSNPLYDPNDPEQINGPEMLVPSTWDSYPQKQVVDLLKYHILRVPISITEAKDYRVYYETLAYEQKGDTTLLCANWIKDRNCRFQFNNFPGTRITNNVPITSNIKCTNGYIHVFNDWMAPPTKEILAFEDVKY